MLGLLGALNLVAQLLGKGCLVKDSYIIDLYPLSFAINHDSESRATNYMQMEERLPCEALRWQPQFDVHFDYFVTLDKLLGEMA